MRPPESWRNARVTLVIAGVTSVAWILQSALGLTEAAVIWGGFIPIRADVAAGDEMLAPFLLTPLTATFVHSGLVHLAFNMLILLFCGRPVETILGAPQLVILYLLGAYVAAAAHYALGPTEPMPMVGASGAISAVLGAYSMLFGRNRVRVSNPQLATLLNALWLAAAWVVLQIIVGLTFETAGARIAIGAHIGGFLVGLLLAKPLLLLRYRKA